MASEAQNAYLAGLIDSEGCITINKSKGRYFQLSVRVSQANKAYLQHWRDVLDMGSIHAQHNKQFGKPGYHSQVYQWVIMGKAAEELLTAILPYMILKADEAKTALEFREVKRQQAKQYKGRDKPRITEEMIAIREGFKNKLVELKAGRKDLVQTTYNDS